MTRIIKCIAIILVFLACNIDRENIITLLGSKQNYKRVTSKVYGSQNGYCSSSLFLNSDSTFLSEGGCEGRSNVTIGTWKFVKDSIELCALEDIKLCLISNIKLSNKQNKSHTIFKIFDKTGQPVSNFIIFPMRKSEKYIFTSDAGIVLNSNDKYAKNYKTNNCGLVDVDISKYDTLAFPQLERIASRKFKFSAESLPDTIIIHLNANNSGFQYSNIKYDYWKHSLKFKVDKNKLLNTNYSLEDEND